MNVDVSFDFTTDTPRYWDGFWERRNGLNMGKIDLDTFSPALREYHKILCSWRLPTANEWSWGMTIWDI